MRAWKQLHGVWAHQFKTAHCPFPELLCPLPAQGHGGQSYKQAGRPVPFHPEQKDESQPAPTKTNNQTKTATKSKREARFICCCCIPKYTVRENDTKIQRWSINLIAIKWFFHLVFQPVLLADRLLQESPNIPSIPQQYLQKNTHLTRIIFNSVLFMNVEKEVYKLAFHGF